MKGLFLLAALCVCTVHVTDAYGQSREKTELSKTHTAGTMAGAKLFSRAADLQNRQDWDAAIATWRAFLRQHPQDPLTRQAHNYLGVCLLQKESFQSAATEFEQVLKDKQDDEIAEEAHLNLGWCYYSQGFNNSTTQLSKAAKIFSAHTKNYPNSAMRDQALFYLAESLLMTDRPQLAIESYQRLIKDHADSPLRADALYALGAALVDQQESKQAQAAFHQLARDYPEHAMAREAGMRYAEALMDAGDWEAAADAFAALAEVGGDGTDYALLRLGLCLERWERFGDAATIYAKIPSQHAASEFAQDAMLGAGRSYALAHDAEHAKQWLARVELEDAETEMEVAHWQCRLQLLDNAPHRAVSIAKAALDKHEQATFRTEVALDHAEAMSLIPSSRRQAAKQYLEIATALPDGELQWRAALGAADCLLQLRRADEASKLARDFLDKHQEHEHRPAFEYILAESYRLDGDRQQARELLETLLADHQDHPLAPTWRRRLARVLLREKQHEEALVLLDRVETEATTAEEKSEAFFFRAIALDELLRSDEAIAAYQRAYDAQPDGTWSEKSLLAIAELQNQAGQPQQAESTLELAQSRPMEPDADQRAKLQLAEAALNAGQHEKATKIFAELSKHGDSESLLPHALFGQGYSRLYERNYQQSNQLFTQFIRTHPGHPLEPHAYYGRALASGYESNYAQGIRDLERVLTVQPQVKFAANALYLKGLYEHNLKRYADSTATFRTLLDDEPNYARKETVLYQLAMAAAELGDISASVQWTAKLAEQSPHSKLVADALVHAGTKSFDRGRFDLAERLYQKALQRKSSEPTRQTALYKLAWSQFRQEKYPAALRSFSDTGKTQLSKSRLVDVRFMQAECHFEMQQRHEALAYYQQVREYPELDQPTKSMVLHHGAVCLQADGQWKDSIDWLQELLATDPDTQLRGKTLLLLGQAYDEIGEKRQAYEHLKSAAANNMGATKPKRTCVSVSYWPAIKTIFQRCASSSKSCSGSTRRPRTKRRAGAR